MKRYHHTIIILLIVFAVLLTACGNPAPPPAPTEVVATALPAITNIPDPCAPENIEAEVQKIHNYMREFDDASSLAGSIMQGINKGQIQMSELSNSIPNLQKIRREAEDQPTPACLVNLKTFQISHMYAVINSLNAFLAGDQQTFDQNITVARQQHDQYALELARLLGQTVIPLSTLTPQVSETSSP